MIIIGLTGSIAMGKSRTAAVFRKQGVPVFDSDAVVHELLGPGGQAVERVGDVFPGTVNDGAVDRMELGRRVFGNGEALRRLEALIHPLVGRERHRWIRKLALRRVPVCVLDVPLLFETGGERMCDLVVVVSAPGFLQRQRVLRRPGWNRERLAGAMARQMPDAVKRRLADVVVRTGGGHRPVWNRLQTLLRSLRRNRRVRFRTTRGRGVRSVLSPGRGNGGRRHAQGRAGHGNHRSRSRGGSPNHRDRMRRAT